jgi:H+-transporting ATPase
MIVMLALLNDGAILSIAYDNVHYKNQPEEWNMKLVLGISTVLGVLGVIAAFGLFFIGDRVFHIDRAHLQTLMYLKLSVAGHMTIFLTRTRGRLWSIRPAKILWMAVLGTQITATLIAVYGFLMTPLGWGWAGMVWGYALVWALVNDQVKVLAYRIFDPVKKTNAKPEAKVETKPDSGAVAKPDAQTEVKPGPKGEAKPQTKAEAKPEVKPEVNAENKPETKGEARPEAKPDLNSGVKAKTPSDLTPQIAKRAYELYEKRGRQGGQSEQDWVKAESEIGKDGARSEAKDKTKAGPQPEDKAEPKLDVKGGPRPETKTEAKPEVESESKTSNKGERQPEGKGKSSTDLTPQIVKKVHELYEELGRAEVQAVEEMERTDRESVKNESRK